MGLVKCPDCGKEFSDRINACPNCSCPLEYAVREQNEIRTISMYSNIKKEELMSSKELKRFAFESIYPYIQKELNNKILEVIKGNSEEIDADYYLKTDNEIIALEVFVEVAPSKNSYRYNMELAQKMNKKGYKYAVAIVGIGSTDAIRFDRRVVLNNDNFYIDYKSLKFLNVEEFKGIKYSLSLEKDFDKEIIYERQNENSNPYIIQKPKKDYRNNFSREKRKNIMNQLWEDYLIPVNYFEYLYDYIDKLAEAIDFQLDVKESLINFLNCVDYCKGFYLSDSTPVNEDKIIIECVKFLENNIFIELSKYDKYVFAFYVYHYLVNGELNASPEYGPYMNKLKIKLYEEKPEYFFENCK